MEQSKEVCDRSYQTFGVKKIALDQNFIVADSVLIGVHLSAEF